MIVLFSYSIDKNEHIVDFIEACANSNVYVKSLHSSFEEEVKESNGENRNIVHIRSYLVMGGNMENISNIFNNIISLSNEFLIELSFDIRANCSPECFTQLFDYGVINENYFEYYQVYKTGKYMDRLEATTQEGIHIMYNNPEVIFSNLPNGFTSQSILKFIKIIYYNEKFYKETNAYELIELFNNMDNPIATSVFEELRKPLYGKLVKKPSIENILKLIDPLYLQIEGDEIFAGDVDDETLDEIFRQQYDKFTGVYDDTIHYEDIDEELAADEETENMRPEDVINDET